jgi:hypothetical protein
VGFGISCMWFVVFVIGPGGGLSAGAAEA